jgi:zinc and cadmium transporter
MPTLVWVLAAGLSMALLALSGSLTLLLSERTFKQLVLPLVALAAGSLVGGALFHLLPQAVASLGNRLAVYGWLAAGLFGFLLLEQYLHWHHCHRPLGAHRPLGYLILVADALHNLIGGLAIGAAFVTDTRLGVVTWLVAAAHEVPQELGDFGILVHSGWSRRSALATTWPRPRPSWSGRWPPTPWPPGCRWRCCWRLRPATSCTSPWPIWSRS